MCLALIKMDASGASLSSINLVLSLGTFLEARRALEDALEDLQRAVEAAADVESAARSAVSALDEAIAATRRAGRDLTS